MGEYVMCVTDAVRLEFSLFSEQNACIFYYAAALQMCAVCCVFWFIYVDIENSIIVHQTHQRGARCC